VTERMIVMASGKKICIRVDVSDAADLLEDLCDVTDPSSATSELRDELRSKLRQHAIESERRNVNRTIGEWE
jgi:hypothetical protein